MDFSTSQWLQTVYEMGASANVPIYVRAPPQAGQIHAEKRLGLVSSEKNLQSVSIAIGRHV